MKKYLVEFIGTLFLVLAIGLTGNPLAIGSMLMVMTFAGAHVSGAHYNPAVTFALWLRGGIAKSEIVGYLVAQFAGAAGAALLTDFFGSPSDGPKLITISTALVAELLGTFALVYVYLNVMQPKEKINNSFYGIAIGFTMLAGVYVFGGVSGGAFNPAVVLGNCLRNATAWADSWIYLAAELGAAVLAAYTFRFINSSPENL